MLLRPVMNRGVDFYIKALIIVLKWISEGTAPRKSSNHADDCVGELRVKLTTLVLKSVWVP